VCVCVYRFINKKKKRKTQKLKEKIAHIFSYT
jgi:hypothetical protein